MNDIDKQIREMNVTAKLLEQKVTELDDILTNCQKLLDLLLIERRSLGEQADAWRQVCKLVEEIDPDWAESALSGKDCVLRVIRNLAKAAGKLTPISRPPDSLLQ